MLWKQPKTFAQYNNQIVQEILIGLPEPWWSGKQSQVGLIPWNQRPCSKPKRQIRWVIDEFGISQSIMVLHIHDFSKSIQSSQNILQITKILPNFRLTLIRLKKKRNNNFIMNKKDLPCGVFFIWESRYINNVHLFTIFRIAKSYLKNKTWKIGNYLQRNVASKQL